MDGGKIQWLCVVADFCEDRHAGDVLPTAGPHESLQENRRAVLAFLECRGEERDKTRLPLFSPDGRVQMEFHLPSGLVSQDVPVADWLASSSQLFPDWGFYDNELYESDHPCAFLVRCNGRGHLVLGDEKIPVRRQFFNEFRLRDGKIWRFREILIRNESN